MASCARRLSPLAARQALPVSAIRSPSDPVAPFNPTEQRETGGAARALRHEQGDSFARGCRRRVRRPPAVRLPHGGGWLGVATHPLSYVVAHPCETRWLVWMMSCSRFPRSGGDPPVVRSGLSESSLASLPPSRGLPSLLSSRSRGLGPASRCALTGRGYCADGEAGRVVGVAVCGAHARPTRAVTKTSSSWGKWARVGAGDQSAVYRNVSAVYFPTSTSRPQPAGARQEPSFAPLRWPSVLAESTRTVPRGGSRRDSGVPGRSSSIVCQPR